MCILQNLGPKKEYNLKVADYILMIFDFAAACFLKDGHLNKRGSISALGARWASFLDHFPPVPPPPPHQTICPQELRGDVGPSEFVPFY